MNKRSEACDIKKNVKETVWERDGHRCIVCGSPQAMPNAHYIPRTHGGLGVEENIVTLCQSCHRRYDQSVERKVFGEYIREYLKSKYPDWDEDRILYKK